MASLRDAMCPDWVILVFRGFSLLWLSAEAGRPRCGMLNPVGRHVSRPGSFDQPGSFDNEAILHRTSSVPWQIKSLAEAGALARKRASTFIIWPGQQ